VFRCQAIWETIRSRLEICVLFLSGTYKCIVFEIAFLPVDGNTQHNNSTSSIVFLLFLPHELGSSRRNNDGAWLKSHAPSAGGSTIATPITRNPEHGTHGTVP
jgi:hypothetical protein